MRNGGWIASCDFNRRGDGQPDFGRCAAEAIAPALHGTPCVLRHTKMSLEQGATRNEILETASVAIGMGECLAHTHSVHMREALEVWV